MARFAYDVNTTQRYIDVHKQFQGGLKTVDTDDSLGAVFLRQAENVSLSEFGFLEKRYGTFQDTKAFVFGNIQGYWEFEDKVIYASEGNIYLSSAKQLNGLLLTNKVNDFYLEEGLRYPNFDDVLGGGDYVIRNNGTRIVTNKPNTFQTTRDMNAVNINNVLYIFTGTYPIYAKKVGNNIRFFMFPIDIPSYDEIVITGYNFLEYDFESVLGYSGQKTGVSNYIGFGAKPIIYNIEVFPKTPYVLDNDEKGKLTFKINAGLPNMDFWNPAATHGLFTEISLDSVRFRSSGAGASNLDYINASIESSDFVKKANYNGNDVLNAEEEQIIIEESFLESSFVDFQALTSSRRRYNFNLKGDFFVEKDYILKNKTFALQFLGNDQSGDLRRFTVFDTKNAPPPGGGLGIKVEDRFIVEITPIDVIGNELKKNKIVLKLTQDQIEVDGDFHKVNVPTSLLSSSNVIQYKISFIAHWQDIVESDDNDFFNIQGPGFFEQNPNLYSYSVRTLSQKVLDKEVDLIIAAYAPNLSFSLTDLTSGTYDFEVIFVRKTYNYVNNTLFLQGSEYFSGKLENISITQEPFKDYPGLVNELKLKSVWSCNKVFEHFNKLMIWGSTEMPTAVFYSFPDRPSYFPTKFYLDFTNNENNPVESVVSYMNILVVQTADKTWGIRGNSGLINAPAPYISFVVNPSVGTIAYKSVRSVRNHLFFLSKQGIIALKSLYAADEQYNIDFMDLNIRNIVPQDTKAVGIQYDNQYWLNFPNFGITLRWYIDKKAWVQDMYSAWDNFAGVVKWQVTNGKLEFITHPSRFEDEGNLNLYKIGVDYSLPTDLGYPVVAKFETSFLNQNYPFHPKNYKEAKLDFTLQNEYNLGREAIYEMDTNEDISGQIHTIQGDFKPNHRYRIQYNFLQEEEVIIDGGFYQTPENQFIEFLEGGATYELQQDDELDLLYFYAISQAVINGLVVEIFPIDFENVDIILPNNIGTNEELVVIGSFAGYSSGASVRDVTYDDALTFKTWVISESETLNIDNYSGYDQAVANVNLDLTIKNRMGDWVFGTSDFGNKVTAIKTIKLAGKGYNVKLYMEDYTKSKWTLESLGLTYKMKRARSR